MSRVCREHSLLRCGTCGEIECLEKTISQQAEIIKILSEACEFYGSRMSWVRDGMDFVIIIDSDRAFYLGQLLCGGKRARQALAQVEKLKGK